MSRLSRGTCLAIGCMRKLRQTDNKRQKEGIAWRNRYSLLIPESVTSIGPWAIGYRELQFLPYWDPVPFGRPVIIYGKPGSEAERYTKDNHWRFNEHITEFREIKTDAGKLEGES